METGYARQFKIGNMNLILVSRQEVEASKDMYVNNDELTTKFIEQMDKFMMNTN
jgi:hypothetical protein